MFYLCIDMLTLHSIKRTMNNKSCISTSLSVSQAKNGVSNMETSTASNAFSMFMIFNYTDDGLAQAIIKTFFFMHIISGIISLDYITILVSFLLYDNSAFRSIRPYIKQLHLFIYLCYFTKWFICTFNLNLL